MSDFKRSDRVAEMIQRKLAQVIPQEIKDPRWAGFVTITAVKVSSDLGYAKVYFTVLNAEVEPTADILNASASYLQTLIARGSKLRIVPRLKFLYDESIAYALHLNALIDKANPLDE